MNTYLVFTKIIAIVNHIRGGTIGKAKRDNKKFTKCTIYRVLVCNFIKAYKIKYSKGILFL